MMQILFVQAITHKSYYPNDFLDGLDPKIKYLTCHMTLKSKKALPNSIIKQFYEEEIAPCIAKEKVDLLVIDNAAIFKAISGYTKAEPYFGYILQSKKYPIKCTYSFSNTLFFFDPVKAKEKTSHLIRMLNSYGDGTYVEPGKDIIKDASYARDATDIYNLVQQLYKYSKLTMDLETFSLKHYSAGIASVAFAWDEHSGIAFTVDKAPNEPNNEVRKILRNFLQIYKGILIFHNIAFDGTVSVYQLFMEYLTDTEGCLKGLKCFPVDRFEDTKLIAYLATNSCSRPDLGLKSLSQEFAGNYAQEEIGDVTQIPVQELLKYNLTDCLATWFVYNKYYPKMVKDNQEEIYKKLFKPITLNIIQMQLNGMPIDLDRVKEVKAELVGIRDKALATLKDSRIIQQFIDQEKASWLVDEEKRRSKLKRPSTKPIVIPELEFNPNSNQQVSRLLYEQLAFPVLDRTDSGSPAVGQDTLEKLVSHTMNQEAIDVLQALIDYAQVEKIITAFIPAFEEAQYDPKTDCCYIYGNQNLGGTISGRLSSSNPNLANLPSNSKFGKLIKSCFRAPRGWLFVGIDFNALEARIDALVTRDPAKLAVYSSGYDSHMYNAYYYWPEKCPGIRVLSEDNTKKCFSVIIDGQEHLLLEGDKIELPNGQQTTIERAYNLLSNKGNS